MYDVVDAVVEWRRVGIGAAVARVVETSGFGSRRPGEALAVRADGRRSGGILGGAVDAAVLTEAIAIAQGGGGLRRVDVPVSADTAAACGSARSGHAVVLVQSVDDVPDDVWTALGAGRPTALLTRLSGSSTALDDRGLRELLGRRPGGRSGSCLLELDAGRTAIEWWLPTGRMVVTGAEELAAAVVAEAQLLGWDAAALPQDAAVLAARHAGPADAVVVLTHDPALDQPVLLAALGGRAGYIGAIGSRGTQVDRTRRLAAAGADDAQLARIHGPVGLDLGGTNVAETALSICAEILATRSGRPAAALRDTSGPITG